ncbi:FAD-dependent monooxygenase [Candidatus Rhabdochlamydia sp. T3358]|uniref:FAD-dependent monooxygenase n=1 Tax=Candidatus Rhabdochlamydia sp. T3358 TaxID=2099795 RepID=UPI0010B5D23C|nr:FAD-dependent monooxygenase [Candidatus Rhabdochlamydia sp. T3358]VHO04387.1 Pentachlorophenol 4-monooxygenase [Candidatus Rhabdochlamydia sp. T3358]
MTSISACNPNELPLALIVGGGPAGLVMANLLQLYQNRFCLIEQRTSSSDLSKATGLHKSTLKLLDKLNLIDKITERSIELNGNNLYVEGKLTQKIVFEQGRDLNDKNVSMHQSSLEEILQNNLTSSNKDMRWGKKLVSFKQSEDSVTAIVQDAVTGAMDSISARFLVAADGAKSTVRKEMGISFEGVTTPEISFTFDAKVIASFPTKNEMAMYTTKELDRLVVVPLPEDLYKFSGKVSDAWFHRVKSCEELTAIVLERSGIKIDPQTIGGVSFYHTASKIATCMNDRRVFLIGDAAHVFFPAGGYGLNAAIEDAFSLAWRLNLSSKKIFNSVILDDFSRERLENALQIQADSNQKKADSEKINSSAGGLVKEMQIYNQAANNSSFVRVDTIFSINDGLKENSRLVQQNLGFSLLVNTTSKKNLTVLDQFSRQIEADSGLTFRVIQLTNEETFLIPDETLCLIRPDNFAKIFPLNLDSLDYSSSLLC